MKQLLKLSEEIEHKTLDGETYILSYEKGRIFKLNELGTDFLNLIDGKKSTEEIINILLEQYNVDEMTLKKDINSFVEKCLTNHVFELL